MNILSLEKISKIYGSKPLFEGLTLGFEDNDRIGIIGPNGSGKSTLLRIIAGEEMPDSGRVVFAEGKVLAYLSQNPAYDADISVMETIFAASSGVMKLIRDYEMACQGLALQAEPSQALLDQVSEHAQKIETSGGWDLETNARIVLSKLGISNTESLMGTLSGGQRKRVALAHALIVRPDMLILDEPTNHLDADTVGWLESYLVRYTGTLLLVTHDRYFLDRISTRILEIDQGNVQTFSGNYAYYLEKKAEQELQRVVEDQKRKMLIRRELAWLRRGVKARTSKSKARIDAADALINQPQESARAEISISAGASRLGNKVIEAYEVSKNFTDQQIIDNLTFKLTRHDRIGVIGPNGSGKTTLLEIIAGRIKPDTGRVETGPTVVLGYYDQESRELNSEQRVIDYIREVGEQVTAGDGTLISAGQMLERFLFPPPTQYAPIAKLSGGERRRLYLLRILMSAPNVLLLDEPTNDLDIPTLMALEEYLDDFPGSLIVVSHDRYFLDRTINKIFRIEDGGQVKEYPGDYSAYLGFREREIFELKEQTSGSQSTGVKGDQQAVRPEPEPSRKLSFKEKRELETIELQIESGEARKSEIESLLYAHASDAEKVQALYTELQELINKLDQSVERWAELALKADF